MRIYIITALVLLCFSINAQLTHGGNPAIDLRKGTEKYNISSIQLKDFSQEEIRKFTLKDTMKNIIGQSIDVNIDFIKDAKFIETENHYVYLLELTTNSALGLNLTFSKFILPNDAKMFVWSNNSYFGAYTNENMRKDSTFHIATFKSNNIVIELDFPKNTKTNDFSINIDKVGYFFDWLFFSDFTQIQSGLSAECHNNVNCVEWIEWCNQIRSTALFAIPYLEGGWVACSGAMVNNFSQDFTPYFLTAEHCITDDEDLGPVVFSDTEFHFNYQSPFCANQDMFSRSSVIGSELLASCEKTDVALLEISNKIPEQFNVYFAGYDTRKRNDMPTDQVVGIHHPQFDLKKISKGNWQMGGGICFSMESLLE